MHVCSLRRGQPGWTFISLRILKQELGLEKQKDSAREILAAAKVAEVEAAERERTAAETRYDIKRTSDAIR